MTLEATPWDGKDRKALQEWTGGSVYRLAFLCHVVPVKLGTLERIIRGYHDPSGLLAQRLREMIARFPKGTKLPHPERLLES